MVVMATITAIIYNTWPLGFILNNPIAHRDLASQLEATGQPYNWLFVSTDVLTGLIVIILAMMFWRRLEKGQSILAIKIIVIGLLMFGLFTAVSALVPLTCQTTDLRCGSHLYQIFGLHDLTGGIAAIGLFISLVGGWLHGENKPHALTSKLIHWTTILWCLCGIAYVYFSAVNQHMVLVQQIFLVLSGIAVIVICLPTDTLILAEHLLISNDDTLT